MHHASRSVHSVEMEMGWVRVHATNACLVYPLYNECCTRMTEKHHVHLIPPARHRRAHPNQGE
jgi:hypothetical protein